MIEAEKGLAKQQAALRAGAGAAALQASQQAATRQRAEDRDTLATALIRKDADLKERRKSMLRAAKLGMDLASAAGTSVKTGAAGTAAAAGPSGG